MPNENPKQTIEIDKIYDEMMARLAQAKGSIGPRTSIPPLDRKSIRSTKRKHCDDPSMKILHNQEFNEIEIQGGIGLVELVNLRAELNQATGIQRKRAGG